MGLTISLENEKGNIIATVEDLTNILHRVVPNPDNPYLFLANTIDWYGDTVFNHLQAKLLRKEWSYLINEADTDTATFLKEIDALLVRCETGSHLYVKFYGD